MPADPILVFANGRSLQPRRFVEERARLGIAAVSRLGAAVAADAPALGCPISESGTLDTTQRYRNAAAAGRGYYLPAYATGVWRASESPFERYDVRLELTPDAATAARLRVRLQGARVDAARPELRRSIAFETLPDGRRVEQPRVLRGDEFRSLGVRFAGSPLDAYCSGARSVAVAPARPPAPAAALTPCVPDDPERCSCVPVEIAFDQAVSSVTLEFFGAALPYTLKAFDPHGKVLGEAQQAPSKAYTGASVSVSVAQNGIARVSFGHLGPERAVTAVTRLGWERLPDAGALTDLSPLPHDVRVSLRFVAAESGGAATWKSVGFDEAVAHLAEQRIEAVARLRTLPELDAVHRALVDPAARAELVVHCEAELAVRSWRQIYVPRALGDAKPAPDAARLYERVNAAPTLEELVREGRVRFRRMVPEPRPDPVRPNVLDPVRPNVLDPVRPNVLDPVRPNVLVPHALPGPVMRADPVATRPQRRLSLSPAALAGKYLGDAAGEPAYVKVRAECDQRIPFRFDPDLHAYIYPPRAPASGPGLVSHQAGDRVIYQDAVQRDVFYYVPDEFRLARDDVRSPTYKPSLQVAFFSTSEEDGADDDQATAEYGVQLTFRAVPFLDPAREAEARRVIREKALVPGGAPPSLLPLAPQWAQLTLDLPVEGGAGIRAEVRPDATVVFDRYVVDSLALSSSAFAAVFQSMRAGGETLNGTVRYRLAGSSVEHGVPFSGRLDKLVGPVLDAELDAQAPTDGAFQVELTNGIESPVTLRGALVRLLDDPDAATWTLAPVAAEALPLQLGAGESRAVAVRPGPALAGAYGVRLAPTRLDVALDFEKLWLSVLETPGWEDVTQPVSIGVDPSCFSGPAALDRVTVSFNAGEAAVELTAAAPRAHVTLIRSFLAYLLRRETADDYLYRVASWRRPTSDAPPVKVAEGPWTEHDGPVLDVTPPG